MAGTSWILVTALLFFSCVQLVRNAENDENLSNMKRLKDKVLKNYDKHVRPGEHHMVTTRVNISLSPLYVIDLNEENSLFTLDTWFKLDWIDERLKWTESEFNGIKEMKFPDGLLWQPDIVVYNSHSSNIDPKGNTHSLVFPNGNVLWVPPATVTTVCPVEISDDYPNDIQRCNVTIGSWTHSGDQIDLRIKKENGLELSNLVNSNPRWEVLVELFNFTRKVMKYDCCEEDYLSVIAQFSLKRRPPAHIQVMWSPCVLVMILTLSLFWIPVATGNKLILGVLLFLILTMMMVFMAGATKPPQAQGFAASFIRSTMYAVTAAIVLEIFVINICYTMGSWRPPHLLVHLLSGIAGKIICVWPPPSAPGVGDKLQLKEDGEQHIEVPSSPRDEWILVATALDRLFFIAYIVVLAAIHRQ